MTIKPVASSLLPSTLIDIIENRVAMVKNKKWRFYEKQALHVPETPSPFQVIHFLSELLELLSLFFQLSPSQLHFILFLISKYTTHKSSASIHIIHQMATFTVFSYLETLAPWRLTTAL